MVSRKSSELQPHWLTAELSRINEQSPIVEVRWSVEEVTPEYTTNGYYGQRVPETFVRVSEYFDTVADAESWMGQHVADEGKFLAIRKHVAREHRNIGWVSVRISK